MPTTVHIENTVHDFDAWKQAFDRFDRFRADNDVQSYRVSRLVDEPRRVMVDLEFDTVAEAVAFQAKLRQIHRTPQSRSHLVSTSGPLLLEMVEQKAFGVTE